MVPLGLLIEIIPWRIAYWLAELIGKIYFIVDTKGKKQANKNLDIIFKENILSAQNKNQIIRNLYIHTASYIIEYLKIGSITANNYRNFGSLEGFENLNKALAMGKGLIVVTAHLGNWDYLATIPAKLGLPAYAIINRQSNPLTDKWLKNIREKKGNIHCFYNEITDLTKIIKSLKQNTIIANVADQTYYFKPIFVPFFGIPCATADGPAKLHLKFHAPILFAVSYRASNGRYVFKYEEPAEFKSTGNFDKDCETIMTWINQRYEFYIRQYPDQWFTLLSPRWEITKPEDLENINYDPYR